MEYSNLRMIRCVAMFLILLCDWVAGRIITGILFAAFRKTPPFGLCVSLQYALHMTAEEERRQIEKTAREQCESSGVWGRLSVCVAWVYLKAFQCRATKTLYEFERRMPEECCSPGKVETVHSDDPGDLPSFPSTHRGVCSTLKRPVVWKKNSVEPLSWQNRRDSEASGSVSGFVDFKKFYIESQCHPQTRKLARSLAVPRTASVKCAQWRVPSVEQIAWNEYAILSISSQHVRNTGRRRCK